MIRRFDAHILDRVGRLAGKFQQLTGWDCLKVARAWSILAVASLAVIDSLGGKWYLVAWWLLSLWCEIWGIALDDEIRADLVKGFRNKRRESWFSKRVFTYFFIIVISALVVYFGFNAILVFPYSFFGILVLRSCDPLPPCSSKIKQWIKGTFTVLVPSQQAA